MVDRRHICLYNPPVISKMWYKLPIQFYLIIWTRVSKVKCNNIIFISDLFHTNYFMFYLNYLYSMLKHIMPLWYRSLFIICTFNIHIYLWLITYDFIETLIMLVILEAKQNWTAEYYSRLEPMQRVNHA